MSHTIVLVHGAFAENASWDAVSDGLQDAGHHVICAGNPLRDLAPDAESVTDVVRAIDGPVLLVGHSYGGMVVSNVDPDAGELVGVVYVAAFAPDTGESAFSLSEKFLGSTLGQALRPVPRTDGTTDLYIRDDAFGPQFCADVPAEAWARLAASQRPVTQEALTAPCGDRPLWKEIPSWFVFGEEDRNIPAELQRFMAERAGARGLTGVPGASHALAVSRPDAVVDMVLAASRAPAAAA